MILGQPCCKRIAVNISVLVAYFLIFLLFDTVLWYMRVTKFIEENQNKSIEKAAEGAAMAFPSVHSKGFAGVAV
jgi:mannose/fructose/N-acetylgalactosamine-specific phosphotransferase system component IIC